MRSVASAIRACLHSFSWSQFLQSPSCLYQTWMPFLVEKVIKVLVLKWELYPSKKPFTGSMVWILILFIFAVSSSDSAIFKCAMSKALCIVCRLTWSSRAMLASCSPTRL